MSSRPGNPRPRGKKSGVKAGLLNEPVPNGPHKMHCYSSTNPRINTIKESRTWQQIPHEQSSLDTHKMGVDNGKSRTSKSMPQMPVKCLSES